MPRYQIEMTDASTRVHTAVGYHEADGYLHFTDELGDSVFTVNAVNVAAVECLRINGQGSDAGHQSQPEEQVPGTDTDGAVLLIRFWSEPGHAEALREVG